jgi:hypothetical protein
MTADDPRPAISAEEIARRREALRQADANNRLEGITTYDAVLEEICEAYIRGEIEAGDLVAAYIARAKRTGKP